MDAQCICFGPKPGDIFAVNEKNKLWLNNKFKIGAVVKITDSHLWEYGLTHGKELQFSDC